jgi:AcrR family transcriptional regulator
MASALGEHAFEDLTARDRIREAAIGLFAERGIDATAIRDIARAAGVSGGLVRHHFGSKEDLRTACDSYVLAQMIRFKERAVGSHGGDAAFISAAQPALLIALRYFARSMLDGSPAADAMFTEMIGQAEGWLDEHHRGEMSDPKAYAALLVAMEIGALVMREQLSSALGSDIFEAEGNLRLAQAKLDLYSRPLLAPNVEERVRAALDQVQQPSPPKPDSRRGGNQ